MKKALAGRVDAAAASEQENRAGVEETTGTPGGAPKKTSKARSFDDTPTGSNVPDGKYEAIIKQMVLQEADEKGQSVRFTVIFASEDVRGEEITGWFKLVEADGETAAAGAKFFKRCVALFGYTDVKLADVEEICEEISRDQPGCAVQKKTNEGFDNVYFNGLIEDSPAIRATHEAGFLN